MYKRKSQPKIKLKTSLQEVLTERLIVRQPPRWRNNWKHPRWPWLPGAIVGIVGMKGAEAVGRNPDASGAILVQSIIGMALAEAVAFYSLF